MKNNSRIGTKFPVDLSCPGIDGMHPCGALLQQTICEPARRGPYIQTNFAFYGDVKRLKSRLDLQPASAYILQGLLHFNARFGGHSSARLVCSLPIYADLSRQESVLALFRAIPQAVFRLVQRRGGAFLPLESHLSINDEVGDLPQAIRPIVKNAERRVCLQPLLFRHFPGGFQSINSRERDLLLCLILSRRLA